MRPVLFTLGSLPIYSFGVMIALGLSLSLYLMGRRARRDGFPTENQAFDMVFVGVLAGFLSARLHYVIQSAAYYKNHLSEIFQLWQGGLIFYGGMIGSFMAVVIFFKLQKIKLAKGFDFLMPFVALTHAFGRLGCFLNGCCYGKVCDLPWAVKFPGLELPVHPTQIYEAVYDLAVFLFLNAFYPRKKFNGQIASLYFILYAIGRFAVEFLRADNPMFTFLTYNQWISIAVFAAGLVVYKMLSRHQKAAS